MRFKVGDKVRVRTDLEAGRGYRLNDSLALLIPTNDMCAYRGKVLTISAVYHSHYITLEADRYFWTDDMFEPNAVSASNVSNGASEVDLAQKIVITSNGSKSVATLYDGDEKVKSAEAAMPEGVDFDFMGCAKRALKELAKEPGSKRVCYNGKMVCLESQTEVFTPGKIYVSVGGCVKADNGNTWSKVYKLNNDKATIFCQLGDIENPSAKFVTASD